MSDTTAVLLVLNPCFAFVLMFICVGLRATAYADKRTVTSGLWWIGAVGTIAVVAISAHFLNQWPDAMRVLLDCN